MRQQAMLVREGNGSMAELSETQKRRMIEALQKRGAHLPCPRCAIETSRCLMATSTSLSRHNLVALSWAGPVFPL